MSPTTWGIEAKTSKSAKLSEIDLEKNIPASGKVDFRFLFFNNTVLFVSCIDLTDIYWVPSASRHYARVPSIIRCGPHLGRAYSLTRVRERKKQAERRGGGRNGTEIKDIKGGVRGKRS